MSSDEPNVVNDTVEFWKAKAEQLTNELMFEKDKNENLTISLEVANERFIEQINKNNGLELQIRKIAKKNG